jgi:two-component system OmpR family sensor kinase/two-component system sensor histidine kinase BaeS
VIDPQHSVRVIRRRLFVLLMQAFGTVVVLTVLILVGLIGLLLGTVTSGNSDFRPPMTGALEAYYLGHGGWAGVEALAAGRSGGAGSGAWGEDWAQVTLLDRDGTVLLQDGQATGALVGQRLPDDAGGVRFPIDVDGQRVGTLLLRGSWPRRVVGLFSGLAVPVLFISFFTGLLTLIIGWLLARRVVTPLADVIAAAQFVAAGDLSTRVQVRGPGDLRTLSDSFNRMAGALEASDRQRRSLLADIAHELRTPLTVIRGKLEGVLDGIYPADEAHVAPVLAETYVLERLVDDLRTLTLAESRQLHFDLRPLALEDLAADAATVFEAEAADRGVSLCVQAEPGLPPVVADPQRTSQVIGNLVANALRFAPENGRIQIDVRRALPRGVELAVTDNGPGVPEPDLPRIFDRFWRAERSRSRATGGAGLGLAIARQLIEAQGGTITAANTPAGGLRVAFTLSL